MFNRMIRCLSRRDEIERRLRELELMDVSYAAREQARKEENHFWRAWLRNAVDEKCLVSTDEEIARGELHYVYVTSTPEQERLGFKARLIASKEGYLIWEQLQKEINLEGCE